MVARATIEMTMPTGDEIKLPLTSRDVNAERLVQFRELFPEASTEGKFDLKKLAQLLGDAATDAPERYGLSWSGKSEAIRAIQNTSPGTLLPAPGESVNFDTTENLIIEGDNLESLKLLQGGYHGRVKMIYIDPPYNTGNEFIYPDNFKEGLADYLRFSGQVSGEGIKLATNTETDGRYHSKWLTMMYPRLFLAKNLLREDGVIFVSIDDHEVHNLRAVMNEVFGEENFVSVIVVQSNKRGQTYKEVAKTHEYILVYSREPFLALSELEKESDALPHKDSAGAFDLWELRNRNPKFGRHNRPNLFFPIYVAPELKDENGYAKISVHESSEFRVKVVPRNSEGEDGCWRWSTKKIDGVDLTSNLAVVIAKQRKDGEWNIYEKSRKSTTKAKSLWTETEVISEQGTMELGELGLADCFEHPKPSGLIKKCINIGAELDDIILDFFGGSGTTAQAVLELNAQDGGNRKFILVQLPEPTGRKDFYTIADITKERVRRVIKKLSAAESEKLAVASSQLKLGGTAPVRELDLGFKVFKLASSNFKVWDAAAAPKDGAALAEQLKLMAHNVEDGRPDDALLYELVLKSNLPLTSKIIAGKIGEQPFYDVADGALVICLARKLTQVTLRGLMERKPKGVICLDIAFAGNDQLKANIVLEMKSHGIEFHTA